ncbi:MAG: ATP-binding cassette domain-containing protein [Gemmatimonadetes bacterium]|nr:ATP-binding cassette domain-containing protein [Gemmatimonadota bacterium]
MSIALSVRDVARSWHAGVRDTAQSVQVLRSVTFHLNDGDIAGLHGARGAGKTTLLCVIAGLLTADRGAVTIFGEPMRPPRPGGVAWVPERTAWYPFLTVLEALEYYATVRDLTGVERRERVAAALEQVGLGGRAAAAVGDLDRPERKRLALAQALVARPRLLLLDELLTGLAWADREAVLALVRSVAAEGATVLLASRERQAVADCPVLLELADGRVRAPNPATWRLALEVRVEPAAGADRLLATQRGAASLGEGRVRVPLGGASPEFVLARCRELGLGVAWSRVVAEQPRTGVPGGW